MGSSKSIMALLTQLATNTQAARSFRPVHDKFQSVRKDAAMIFLEKADNEEGGQVSLQDIRGALDEYQRLYKAGIASEAELLTLARAFPTNSTFQKAVEGIEPDAVMVVGGPASVEMIDREGHLITSAALSKAFEKYMENFRTRNAMVLHSDVQVGWALPAYISKSGQIFKSGPSTKGLFFITEVRKDTRVADKVREQIDQGKLRSYSIAGSAIKVQNMQKGLMPYMQVDEMELAEVTVCEKGVNQGASFDILKAEEVEQTGKISKEQCGYREATSAEQAMEIMCSTCEYFNDDKSCDLVVGKFEDTDYCNLFKPLNTDPDTIETTDEGESGGMAITIKLSEDGKPDYMATFLSSLKKENGDKLTDKQKEDLITSTHPNSAAFNPDNPEGVGESVLDNVIMERNPNQDVEPPRQTTEVPPELQAKWDAEKKEESEDEEYNNLESFQNFIKGIKSDASSASTVDVATTNMDDGKVGISPNTVKIPLLDSSKNKTTTVADPIPDIIPGSTKLGVASFKDSKGNVIKIFKDILAQQQWTIDEEPPSFNWGPYGLQNKSNLG